MNSSIVSTLRLTSLFGGLLGAALLIGCGPAEATGGSSSSGSGSSGSGGMVGGGAGKEEFVNNVFPKLTRCAGCHVTGASMAPIYLAADAAGSYDLIKTKTKLFTTSENSDLILKGVHSGQQPLEEDGKAAVRKWLDIEFPPSTASGGVTPPPTGATGFNAAVAEFSTCMRAGDWDELMATFPFVQTIGFGSCSGCHASGNGGTFLNADKDITFKAIKQVPFVYRLITPVYDGDKIVELRGSKRLIDKGLATSVCFDPNLNICHAPFNVPQDQVTKLDTFQSRTLLRLRDLKCVEP